MDTFYNHKAEEVDLRKKKSLKAASAFAPASTRPSERIRSKGNRGSVRVGFDVDDENEDDDQ